MKLNRILANYKRKVKLIPTELLIMKIPFFAKKILLNELVEVDVFKIETKGNIVGRFSNKYISLKIV